MATARKMLTTKDGPVVISEKVLRALLAIRREKLLAQMYSEVTISQSNMTAVGDALPEKPDWLTVHEDVPDQELPTRVGAATELEAATLRLALSIGASLILIDGPIKESAKLSFMKCEGVISILVQAHRVGHLSAVKPMVKALTALGHEDVVPPKEMLDALWAALDGLE